MTVLKTDCQESNSLEERIENATAVQLLSDEQLWGEVTLQPHEVYRQQLINQMRERAKQLRIPSRSFEGTLAAHLAFKKRYDKEKRQERPLDQPLETPEWCKNGEIDEVKFCGELLGCRSIRCINGQFYDVNGAVAEERLEQEILSLITPYVNTKLAVRVKGILHVLRMQCFAPAPPPDEQYIHLLNGSLHVNGSFMPLVSFCLNRRLNVTYEKESPAPEYWLRFINELLCPEDVFTLQEYLGYCFIPSTKAQKMLFIIGNGGEGKSRIGVVLNELFKGSMVSGSLQDLEQNKFTMAALENRLLFLDDDMRMKASDESQNLKKLVTAEAPVLIERKCVQPYEASLYARLLAFGNVPPRMLYDHSDGMFRRQMILRVKPRAPGRSDDRSLSQRLLAEKDSIFNWCFAGLQRLMANGYEFTQSQQARDNLEEARQDNCNLIRFLQDKSFVVTGDLRHSITCDDLMLCYEYWCRINAETPLKRSSAINYLKANTEKYGIQYNYNIINSRGRHVRGFEGVRQVTRFGSFDS